MVRLFYLDRTLFARLLPISGRVRWPLATGNGRGAIEVVFCDVWPRRIMRWIGKWLTVDKEQKQGSHHVNDVDRSIIVGSGGKG